MKEPPLPMLNILIRLLVFLSALWLVRRILAFLFGPGRRQVNPPSPNATADLSKKMVKDPICGMYMDSRLAVRMETKQETLYFCSDECQRRFLQQSSGD